MYTDAEILTHIPKTEIHVHLEGLASVDTLWRLIDKHRIDIGITSKEELNERFRIHNLNEFVDLFINVIQICIQNEADLEYLMDDTHAYLQENNVRYAEIFYSPTKLLQNGMRYAEIVKRLTRGAERIEQESGIVVRYITDVSRSFGARNARYNLRNHLKYSSDAFVGIGLGGAEQKHAAQEFRRIFKKAAGKGCAVVAHAGEDTGAHSIWDTLKYLAIKRIGHGTSAIQDQKLIEHLRRSQTVMEVCPTSNLYTGKYAQSISAHPIRYFFDQGLNVTINSDDPTPFNTSITKEYHKLLDSGLFTIKELVQIVKNGIYATFLSADKKDALWGEVTAHLNAHGRSNLVAP